MHFIRRTCPNQRGVRRQRIVKIVSYQSTVFGVLLVHLMTNSYLKVCI